MKGTSYTGHSVNNERGLDHCGTAPRFLRSHLPSYSFAPAIKRMLSGRGSKRSSATFIVLGRGWNNAWQKKDHHRHVENTSNIKTRETPNLDFRLYIIFQKFFISTIQKKKTSYVFSYVGILQHIFYTNYSFNTGTQIFLKET